MFSLFVTGTACEWDGKILDTLGTQSSSASTAVDTDRQIQWFTASEAYKTMQPVLLRDSNIFKGITTEAVTLMDCDAAEIQSDTETVQCEPVKGPDAWAVIKTEPDSVTDTDSDTCTNIKSEPVKGPDAWAVIKTEPDSVTDTDSDTYTNIKNEPVKGPDAWAVIKTEPDSVTDTDSDTYIQTLIVNQSQTLIYG